MTQGALSIATFDLARDAFTQLFWRSVEVRLERLTPERISFLQTVLKEEGVFKKKLVKNKQFREKKNTTFVSKAAAHAAALKRRREKDRLKRAALRLLSVTTSEDSRGTSSDSIHSKNDGRESSSAEEQRVKNKRNFSKITPSKNRIGGSSLNLNGDGLPSNDIDEDSGTFSDVPLSHRLTASLPTSKKRTDLPSSMKRKMDQGGQSDSKENNKKSRILVSDTNPAPVLPEPDRVSVIRHTQCEESSVRNQSATVNVQNLKESPKKSLQSAVRKENTEASGVIFSSPRPPVVIPNSGTCVSQPPPHSGQERNSFPTTLVTATTLVSKSSTSVHAIVPSATDKTPDSSPPASGGCGTPAPSSDGADSQDSAKTDSQDSVVNVTYPRLRVKDAASLGIKSSPANAQPATPQYNMPREHLALERCLRSFAMVLAGIWLQFVRLRRSYEAVLASEASPIDVRQTRADYALLWSNVDIYKARALKWNAYLLNSMSRATLLKALIERVRIIVRQEGLQFSDERCLVFYNIVNRDVEHFMRGTFPRMKEALDQLEAGQPLHGQAPTTQVLQGQSQSVQIGHPLHDQPQPSQPTHDRSQTIYLLHHPVQNTQPFQDQSQAGLLLLQGQTQTGQSHLGQSQYVQPHLYQSPNSPSFLDPLQAVQPLLYQVLTGHSLQDQVQAGPPLLGQAQASQSLPGRAQTAQLLPGQPQVGQSLQGRAQTVQMLPGQPQAGQSLPGRAQTAQLLPGQPQAGQSLQGRAQTVQMLPGQPQAGQSLHGRAQTVQMLPGQPQAGQSPSGRAQAAQLLPGQPQAGQSLPGPAQTVQMFPGQLQAGQSLHGRAQTVQMLPGLPQDGQSLPGPAQTVQMLPGQPQAGQSLQGRAQIVQMLPGQPQAGQSLHGRTQTVQMLPGQPQTNQPLPGQPQTSQVQVGSIMQQSAVRCPNVTMTSELVMRHPPPPFPALSNDTPRDYSMQYRPRSESAHPVPMSYSTSLSSPCVDAMQQAPSIDTGYPNHPSPRSPAAVPSQVSAESHRSALPPSAPNSQRSEVIPAHIPPQTADKQHQYYNTLPGQRQASHVQKRNTIWRQAASRFLSSEAERRRKSPTEDDWRRLYPSRDHLLSDMRPGDQGSVPARNSPPVGRSSAYNFVPSLGYVPATGLPKPVAHQHIHVGGMGEGGNNVLRNTEQPSDVASEVIATQAGADSSTTSNAEKQVMAETVQRNVEAILSIYRYQEKTMDTAASVNRAKAVRSRKKGDLRKRKRSVEAPIDNLQEITQVAGQQNGERIDAGQRQGVAKVLKSTEHGHKKSYLDVINKSTTHLDTNKQIFPTTDVEASIYAEKTRVNSAMPLSIDTRVTNMTMHYDKTLPTHNKGIVGGVALPTDPKSVQCDTTMPKHVGRIVQNTGLPVRPEMIPGCRLSPTGVALQLNKTKKCDSQTHPTKTNAAPLVNLAVTKAPNRAQSVQEASLPQGVTSNNNITKSRGIVEAQLKPVAETSSVQHFANGEFVSLSSGHVVTHRFPDKHFPPTQSSLTTSNQNASSSNVVSSASTKGSVDSQIVPKPLKAYSHGKNSKQDFFVATPPLPANTTTNGVRVAAPPPSLSRAIVGTLPSIIEQTIEKIFHSDHALPLPSSKKPSPSSGSTPSKDVPTQKGLIKKAISSTLLSSQSISESVTPAQNANESLVEGKPSEISARSSSEEREISLGDVAKRSSRYSSDDASPSSELHPRPELLFVSAGCDVTEDIEDDDDDVMFVSFERNIVVVDLSDDDEKEASTVLGKASDARDGSTGKAPAVHSSPAKSAKIVQTKSSVTEVVSVSEEEVYTTRAAGQTGSDNRDVDPSQPDVGGESLPCVQCGKEAQGSCSKCMATYYCSKGCMDKHWRLKHRFKCAQAWSIETAGSEGN